MSEQLLAPQKSPSEKSPNEKSPELKLGLRVVLTAHHRPLGIENIALVKAVRLGLVRLGLVRFG